MSLNCINVCSIIHGAFRNSKKKEIQLGKVRIFRVLGVLGFLLFIIVLLNSKGNYQRASASLNLDQAIGLSSFPIIEPTLKYGFVMDYYHAVEDVIKENEFLADILLRHNVPYEKIHKLAAATKDSLDVRTLRANKSYTLLNVDTTTAPDYFIYEPSPYKFRVYDLNDPSKSKEVKRKVDKVEKMASGIIESSLWNTMINNGLDYDLTTRMEDALAWSVDFHHIQKGDQFKLIYEEDHIEGEVVGIGDLIGAYFKNNDHEYFAIYFENERHNGFFDLEGRSMKRAFLKSPVKFSRISSSFGRRFHPILKKRKMHLGTDYAAPKGTPILAVADGVVSKRAFTRNNGRYVKIKHSGNISTQYLHMSKFNSKVKKGSHVKQGQVIGYVGKTGLATGNHVCFRFWKDGKQINHLKQNLPPPDPMPEAELPRYYAVRDSIKNILDSIDFDLSVLSQEVAQKVEDEQNEKSNP